MTVVKDMALTVADFWRGLGPALDGVDYHRVEDGVVSGDDRRGLSIRVRPLPPRRLGGGLFVVERSEVTISFMGYDDAEQEAFLQQFDRAFQRGGG